MWDIDTLTHTSVLLESREETIEEKLRSILAQMDFTYTVRKWDEQGVSFMSHVYVPEVHPITNSIFHEREDEGHVLKVHTYIYVHVNVANYTSYHYSIHYSCNYVYMSFAASRTQYKSWWPR